MSDVFVKRMIYMPDIERANSRAGKYFFSRDTMRFFKSKIVSEYAVKKGRKAYFITSEQPPHYAFDEPNKRLVGSRVWMVREYDTRSHRIESASEWLPDARTAKSVLCDKVGGKMKSGRCTIQGVQVT
jgi:hypothetical protein